MFNNRIIIIIIIIVVLILVFVLTSRATSINGNNTFGVKSPFPLKRGSEGNEVINWQNYLNDNINIPFISLILDGKFGPKTEAETLKQIGKKEVSKSDYRYRIFSEVPLS